MAQNEVDCDSQQYFVVWGGFPLSEYGPIEGKRVIYSQKDRGFLLRVLWWILRSDAIVIHGLFNTKIIIVLLAWFTRTRITWVIWGRDLDEGRFPFVNWLRRFAMRRVDAVVTLDDKDRERFIQQTGRKDVPSLPGSYANPISFEKAQYVRRQPSASIRILIGNSASPSMNHVFVFEKLAHLAGPNVQFWVPLGYGDLIYKKTVLEEGRRLLGNSFFPIESSLTIDDYVQILANMDAAIFYMRHQQALSNILGLVAIGRKVWMNRESGLITTFKNNWNVHLDDFDVFLKSPTLESLVKVDPSQVEKNRVNVLPAFQRERHVNHWREILKRAPTGFEFSEPILSP